MSDEKHLNINKEAILDLNFEQFDAELNGIVEFLGNEEFKCPVDFKLYLKSKSKADLIREITDIKCIMDKKQVEFNIKNVLFGQYYLVSNYDNVYCWNLNEKVDSQIILNINKEKEFFHLKQIAYKLAYKFHDFNVNFKVLNEDNELITQKITSSQAGLSGLFCINQIDKNIFIEFDSCHLLKPILNNENIIELSLNKFQIKINNFFSLTSTANNLLEFKATKHAFKIEVNTILDKNVVDDELTSAFKEVEVLVYEITGSTSASEEEIIQDRSPTFKLFLNNPVFTKTDDASQLKFLINDWLSADKAYLFKPISKKYLFKPAFTKYKLDSINCNANTINFAAKLGLFVKGIIQPSTVDGFQVNLISISNTTTVFTEATDAIRGFYLGPFESGQDIFVKYRIELVKSNYLFKLLNKKLQNGGSEYVLEYSAEKLGELKIIVHEPLKSESLENVLVSLSSSNKLYRKILKTNSSGMAVFDNLEADLYYLLVMMQEYDFTPSSQVINVTSGFLFTLGVDAKRVAFSCYGRVSTINGLAVGDIVIEANGIDDGNDELNCKQSQENTKSDNETGIYRIRGLKPQCKYEISVKQASNNEMYKLIPQSHVIEVKENDILDLNFILIDNSSLTSEITIKTNLISSKSVDFNADSIQKVFRNNIRIKLFKLSQPDSALQTFLLSSNSIFHLPRLARDNKQYLIQAELLTPTAQVTGISAQQQQQQLTVLDRDEIVFQTDKLFKQLTINFDLNTKKQSSSSGSYIDGNGQQYQTIALPLIIIILTIIYFKHKELLEFAKLVKQKIDNNYNNSSAAVAVNDNIPKSNTQKSTQQKGFKQQVKPIQTSDDSSNEVESSSTSSIDVIDNEGNSILPKKVRVRKA